MAKTLTESLAQQVGVPLDQAWEIYRRLLDNNENPKPGDAELLRRVLATLGKTPADFTADLEAWQRDKMYREDIDTAETDKAQAAAVAARKAMVDFDDETRRLAMERDQQRVELIAAAQKAIYQERRIEALQQRRTELHQKHRELFDMEPSDQGNGFTMTYSDTGTAA